MSASYPTSAKSFTTKNTGDFVQPADVNDVQDEITAIEQTLISGPITLGGVTAGALTVTGGSTLTTLSLSGASTLAGVVTLTGGQIIFPATQVPAAGVNTLDDYEEGTWTPVLGGSGGTAGQAYTTQVGRYTKIGKRVTVEAYIVLSNKGTITGNCEIQGLPFTQENTTNYFASGSVSYWDTLATNWVFLCIQGVTNTTVAGVWGLKAAGATLIRPVAADINATSQLVFNFTYMASA